MSSAVPTMICFRRYLPQHPSTTSSSLLVIPSALGNALTFLMFVISLVFFRSEDMAHAIGMFKRLFFWTYPGFLYRTAANLEIAENYVFRQLFSQIGKDGMIVVVHMLTMILLLAVSAFVMTRKNIL